MQDTHKNPFNASGSSPTGVDSTGVNAQFVERDITPFVGGGSKIFAAIDKSDRGWFVKEIPAGFEDVYEGVFRQLYRAAFELS